MTEASKPFGVLICGADVTITRESLPRLLRTRSLICCLPTGHEGAHENPKVPQRPRAYGLARGSRLLRDHRVDWFLKHYPEPTRDQPNPRRRRMRQQVTLPDGYYTSSELRSLKRALQSGDLRIVTDLRAREQRQRGNGPPRLDEGVQSRAPAAGGTTFERLVHARPSEPLDAGVGNRTGTTLYRFFDDRDRLLYVGISSNPGRRFSQHGLAKPWWDQVARSTMEHFPTRSLAEMAERQAIWDENPLYNIRGRR